MKAKFAGIVTFVLLLLLLVAPVSAQQPPEADYPAFPEGDYSWILSNFAIEVEIVGFRDGCAVGCSLVKITNDTGQVYGDTLDENVDVWGNYPQQRRIYFDENGAPYDPVLIQPDTRWVTSRWGRLRPYDIVIPLGVSYLEMDTPWVLISFQGRYSARTWDAVYGVQTPNYNTLAGLNLVTILNSYPQNPEIPYNIIEPLPTPDYSNLCFDFVFLIQGTYNYRVRQAINGQYFELVFSSVSFGDNIEWVAPAQAFYYFEIDLDPTPNENWSAFSSHSCN